jgi:hypothetical protein
MEKIKSFLSNYHELFLIVSAIPIGAGAGFVLCGLIAASQGQEARAKGFWDAGTTSLLAGSALVATGGYGMGQYRRRWG